MTSKDIHDKYLRLISECDISGGIKMQVEEAFEDIKSICLLPEGREKTIKTILYWLAIS